MLLYPPPSKEPSGKHLNLFFKQRETIIGLQSFLTTKKAGFVGAEYVFSELFWLEPAFLSIL